MRDVTRLVNEMVDREGMDGEVVEVELHRAREDLDRTRRQLEERTEELKRRSDQVMDLTSKVRYLSFLTTLLGFTLSLHSCLLSVCLLSCRSVNIYFVFFQLSIREAELAGAQEERDRARADMDETHLAKDEVRIFIVCDFNDFNSS